MMTDADHPVEEQLFPVPERLLDATQCPKPWVSSLEQYKDMHRQSIENPDEFFGKVKTQTIRGKHETGRCTLDGLPQSFSLGRLREKKPRAQRRIGSMERNMSSRLYSRDSYFFSFFFSHSLPLPPFCCRSFSVIYPGEPRRGDVGPACVCVGKEEPKKRLTRTSFVTFPLLKKKKEATELLSWSTPFHKVQHGGLQHGDIAWFLGGQLNASYNCVDRHAMADPDKVKKSSRSP